MYIIIISNFQSQKHSVNFSIKYPISCMGADSSLEVADDTDVSVFNVLQFCYQETLQEKS